MEKKNRGFNRIKGIEAIYDRMRAEGLKDEHDAFEDILMGVFECAAAQGAQEVTAEDVVALVALKDHERSFAWVWLDWEDYLTNVCEIPDRISGILERLIAAAWDAQA